MPGPAFRSARLFFAVAFVAVASNAGAQQRSQRQLSLTLDNDAFNFWMAAWQRSDQEYTSGVKITYGNAWMPWWRSRVWKDVERCEGQANDCLVPTSNLGQDMYNPVRGDHYQQIKGTRPAAGWLYFTDDLRRVREDGYERAELTIGVTGPPSLASFTQRLAHSFAPHYNRPIDWSEQIPFEPGVNVRYERGALLGSGDVLGLQIIPSVSGSAGTVLTEASTSIRGRFGFNLRNPWLAPASRSAPELALFAGVTGRAVGRDLFLDGALLRGGPHVERTPLVYEHMSGISLRMSWIDLTYRAQWRSPTYTDGPSHVWSTMYAAVRFRR